MEEEEAREREREREGRSMGETLSRDALFFLLVPPVWTNSLWWEDTTLRCRRQESSSADVHKKVVLRSRCGHLHLHLPSVR